MGARVLIIDDEDLFREDLATLLVEEGYECRTSPDGQGSLRLVQEFGPDVVLCDIIMPGMGGVEVLEEIIRLRPETGVIMITAYGTLETAVEAFRKGACDYIMKPLIPEDVFRKIERYLEQKRLLREVCCLRRQIQQEAESYNLVGKSEPMQRILDLIGRVARTDSTVLVMGESGTGKEMVTRAIHRASHRCEGPFVVVNCASLPEHLMESELFGHVKGAFTGAYKDKPGFFELADRGTLFLDEVSEMPVHLQAKLLRAIEQKVVVRVGGTRSLRVDIRIVASTNRDLKSEVKRGRFREDLFFRLWVVEIALPPLREHRGDIPLLVEHFVKRYNALLKKNFLGIDPQALRVLLSYHWPGNVRELQNAIEKAMILAQGDSLGIEDFPRDIVGSAGFSDTSDNLRKAVNAYEQEHIRQALRTAGGNREETARRLGINPATLYRKLAAYGLTEE